MICQTHSYMRLRGSRRSISLYMSYMRLDICIIICVCILPGSRAIFRVLTGGCRVSGCIIIFSTEILHPIPAVGNRMHEHSLPRNILLSRLISTNILPQLREKHFSIGAMMISGQPRYQIICSYIHLLLSRQHSQPNQTSYSIRLYHS